MSKYTLHDVSYCPPIYAVATNEKGKWGILNVTEVINSNTGHKEYRMLGIVCSFVYDAIYPGSDHYYTPTDSIKDRKRFQVYYLCQEDKIGLFSTLNGTIVLNPVPIAKYRILEEATTEGLVGCIKLNPDKESSACGYRHPHAEWLSRWGRFPGHISHYVFLNHEGQEVIILEKGWRIKEGFQGGIATISNARFTASIDKTNQILNQDDNRHSIDYDDDPYDLEKMYRAAFEDDPGAEWNID